MSVFSKRLHKLRRFETMAKGRISLEKRKVRKREKRRYRYDDYTPAVALFTKAVRNEALIWIENEVIPLLEDHSSKETADKIYMFNFKDGTIRKFKRSLARFLMSIGRSKGTKYGEMMIFRYFCDPKHSSISCKEDGLRTSINREFVRF